MHGKLNPEVAGAALKLRQSHPHAQPVEVLDLVLAERLGALGDLGSLHPASDIGSSLSLRRSTPAWTRATGR